MGIPEKRGLLFLLKAPILLLLNGDATRATSFTPLSGVVVVLVKQGCPLSPTLFGMLVSLIILKMHGISSYITVLLYVDDLLIIHHPPPSVAVPRDNRTC
mmetsp:Transcript_145752/g.254435  ORF Transcript_145752/g.254435 Transcript_145752/m.254435 type:complete len:100 (-) Transcript_145752:691-990(-)